MKIRKDMIFVVLTTFCLSALMFAVIPIRSSTSGLGEYSPWMDTNDDGKIDMYDIGNVAAQYMTSGDPINKTALLYDVNNTFTQLLNRIAILNSSLTELNQSNILLQSQIDALSSRVNTLESNYSTMLARIDALEEKTAHPLPFSQTSTTYAATTTTAWTDVVNLGVSITLEENSTLLIMFSAEAYNTLDAYTSAYIYTRALVDANVAIPSEITLTPHIEQTGWAGLLWHHHQLVWGAYTYNYFATAIAPGVHNIKMQFRVSEGTGIFNDCTLTVIALPT